MSELIAIVFLILLGLGVSREFQKAATTKLPFNRKTLRSTNVNHFVKSASTGKLSVVNQVLRGGVSGAIGGALQVVTLMWLRTVTSYQYRYGISMQQAAQELYADGGVGRFYRGWEFAILQGPLARFGSVASNDLAIILTNHYLTIMMATPRMRSFSQVLATLLGSVFVTLWRAILMPIDVCKTVAQVEGTRGLETLLYQVSKERKIHLLFEGTTATLLGAFAGHYPWFLVHNILDATLVKPSNLRQQFFRNAWIGFVATAVSDTCSNCFRVIKTVKQALTADKVDLTYPQVVAKIYNEGGLGAIFGRGLMSRILSNGLQAIVFTVVWKLLVAVLVDGENSNKRRDSINRDSDEIAKIIKV